MPPCTCSAAWTTRLPPSDAQNFAVATSFDASSPAASVRGGLQHRELDRLGVDVRVGQPLADRLERADGAVELLALARVLGGDAQRLLARAGDDRADADGGALDDRPERVAAAGRVAEAAVVADERAVEVHHELGSWFIDLLALERDTAGCCGSTRKRPTSSPTRAGTSTRSARCAIGTTTFLPSSRHPSPSRVAVVWGCVERRAQLAQRGGEHRLARDQPAEHAPAAPPSRTARSASAQVTIECSTGIGATARPCSWRIRHSSRNPKPRPPADSGSATPSRFAFANSAQVSRSNQSALSSKPRRRAEVDAVGEDLAREVRAARPALR